MKMKPGDYRTGLLAVLSVCCFISVIAAIFLSSWSWLALGSLFFLLCFIVDNCQNVPLLKKIPRAEERVNTPGPDALRVQEIHSRFSEPVDTGLKDKNGTPILSGSILRHIDGYDFVVSRGADNGDWVVLGDGLYIDLVESLAVVAKDMVVVGHAKDTPKYAAAIIDN